jgi:hypothetical protein
MTGKATLQIIDALTMQFIDQKISNDQKTFNLTLLLRKRIGRLTFHVLLEHVSYDLPGATSGSFDGEERLP